MNLADLASCLEVQLAISSIILPDTSNTVHRCAICASFSDCSEGEGHRRGETPLFGQPPFSERARGFRCRLEVVQEKKGRTNKRNCQLNVRALTAA